MSTENFIARATPSRSRRAMLAAAASEDSLSKPAYLGVRDPFALLDRARFSSMSGRWRHAPASPFRCAPKAPVAAAVRRRASCPRTKKGSMCGTAERGRSLTSRLRELRVPSRVAVCAPLAAGRGASHVVDDGARDVEAAVAGELGAEAQVPVLAVGDEVLVEGPDVFEERSSGIAPRRRRPRRRRPACRTGPRHARRGRGGRGGRSGAGRPRPRRALGGRGSRLACSRRGRPRDDLPPRAPAPRANPGPARCRC